MPGGPVAEYCPLPLTAGGDVLPVPAGVKPGGKIRTSAVQIHAPISAYRHSGARHSFQSGFMRGSP
jgi:hypothetical protein